MGPETAENELIGPINERLLPYIRGEKQPEIANTFLGYFGGGAFFGLSAANSKEVDELIRLVNSQVLTGFPDTFGRASRSPIFGGRGSRQIDIDLQATDVDQLLEAGRAAFAEISRKMPEANIRPQPELELAQPELRLQADDGIVA